MKKFWKIWRLNRERGQKLPAVFLMFFLLILEVKVPFADEVHTSGKAGQKRTTVNLLTINEDLKCNESIFKSVTVINMRDYHLCEMQLISISSNDNKYLFEYSKNKGNGVASRWGCVTDDRNNTFIRIDYSTLGNCDACNWSSVYDDNGKLIATDFFDPEKECDLENISHINKKHFELSTNDYCPDSVIYRINNNRKIINSLHGSILNMKYHSFN